MMKPCVPPEVQAELDAASNRKEEALDRLLSKVRGSATAADEFEAAMRDLIDADERAVEVIVARRKA